jgi:hypothetical protein
MHVPKKHSSWMHRVSKKYKCSTNFSIELPQCVQPSRVDLGAVDTRKNQISGARFLHYIQCVSVQSVPEESGTVIACSCREYSASIPTTLFPTKVHVSSRREVSNGAGAIVRARLIRHLSCSVLPVQDCLATLFRCSFASLSYTLYLQSSRGLLSSIQEPNGSGYCPDLIEQRHRLWASSRCMALPISYTTKSNGLTRQLPRIQLKVSLKRSGYLSWHPFLLRTRKFAPDSSPVPMSGYLLHASQDTVHAQLCSVTCNGLCVIQSKCIWEAVVLSVMNHTADLWSVERFVMCSCSHQKSS